MVSPFKRAPQSFDVGGNSLWLPTCLLMWLLAGGTVAYGASPIYDAHLHYTARDAQSLAPEAIVGILRRHNVARALVTGAPAPLAMELYRTAPELIVPMLGVYGNGIDKENWHLDTQLPRRVGQALDEGGWRAIGELHLFGEHRHSPVFKEIVRRAARRDLPLMMHADPAVIDTLYEVAPKLTVIWAHAGKYPYPDLLSDYLGRYPRLYVDLSMRDETIAPNGRLSDEWYELLIRHSDRFLVGVDTFSTERWRNYGAALEYIRAWLSQLPADVRPRIAFDNAARVLAVERSRSPVNRDAPGIPWTKASACAAKAAVARTDKGT